MQSKYTSLTTSHALRKTSYNYNSYAIKLHSFRDFYALCYKFLKLYLFGIKFEEADTNNGLIPLIYYHKIFCFVSTGNKYYGTLIKLPFP